MLSVPLVWREELWKVCAAINAIVSLLLSCGGVAVKLHLHFFLLLSFEFIKIFIIFAKRKSLQIARQWKEKRLIVLISES